MEGQENALPQYGENMRSEVVRLTNDTELKDVHFSELVWTLPQVMALLNHFEDLCSEDTLTLGDLMELSLRLGRLGRKLDLTGSAATISTIKHTVGLLRFAEYIIRTGNKVRVIEGCDGNLKQVWGDIDLIYSDDEGLKFCDYSHKVVNEPYIWPEKDQIKKYKTLRDISPKGTQVGVVAFGPLFFPDYKIVHGSWTGTPREDDFKFADSLIEKSALLTKAELKWVLDDYSDKLAKLSEDKGGMVQTPTVKSIGECEDLLKVLGHNGEHPAKVYEAWREDAKKKPSFPKYYSGEFHDNVLNSSSRPVFFVPAAERGCHDTNPFDRLKVIKETNLDNGLQPSALFDIIGSSTDSHKTFPSMDYTLYPDGSQWQGVTSKFLYRKDGSRINAVELRFPHGRSWEVVRNEQKQNKDAPVLSYSELEKQYATVRENAKQPGTGGILLDDIGKMIDDVLPDGPLAQLTRKVMRNSFESMNGTRLSSTLSMTQELTMAILNGPRKRQLIRKSVGSFKGQTVVVGLDSIEDRKAVVMSNLGPLSFGETNNVSYTVLGVFDEVDIWNRKTHNGVTKCLTMSPAQMDWNVALVAKCVSWCSLTSEALMVSKTEYVSKKLSDSMIMPMMLSCLNSNKFSQSSEMIRYLFVNATGLSSEPKKLYDKILWYRPKTFVEKLYMLRMCKLIDGLNVAKAMNHTAFLRQRVTVTLEEPNGPTSKSNMEVWMLAMPNDEVCCFSDQHVFNSFYVCRTMTMQRYNKTMSEAMVIEKQRDARINYLGVKGENRQHEGRFRKPVASKDELIKLFLNEDYVSRVTDSFSANPLVVQLGVYATMVYLCSKMKDSVTLDKMRAQKYNLQGVMRKMRTSDILNTRGSVKMAYKHGVMVTHDKLVEGRDKKGRPMNKKIRVTQNSKCYKTVLEACQLTLDRLKFPSSTSDWDVLQDAVECFEPAINLDAVANMNDSLWPILFNCILSFAQCVSKMVHKDQIGAREIAVLNAVSRIMCYYTETIARAVRDAENHAGMNVNLIEVNNKMDIVSKTLQRSLAEKGMDRSVLFDSADCSKWGPSIMVFNLYISLGSRMNNTVHLTVLRDCLTLFGNKVFKIPDNFFEASVGEYSGDNVVSRMMNEIKSMKGDMGNYQNQIFKLEESMHQGILGCSSSVLGSDAQNMTRYCLERLYKHLTLRVTSHITSDDYSRVITWERDQKGEFGVYRVGKETLAIHYGILKDFGITRNLQKSALSDRYLEFNSVFFNPNGEMKPDIKSRISFVDYGHDTDPYPLAYRCATQTAEYLRSEGSFVGSCWVGLLNNVLCMYQNQSRRLYRRLGDDIYKVPLELGGLIRVDPLRAVVSSPFMPLMENYRSTPEAGFREVMANVLAGVSIDPSELLVNEEDNYINVPSASRSGTVHLCKRPSRSSRALREYLMSMDRQTFADLFGERYRSSMIAALIACAHREESRISEEGRAHRYMVTQTPRNASLYKINSRFLTILTDAEKVSRDDLHDMADKYNTRRHSIQFEVDELMQGNEVDRWDRKLSTLYKNLLPTSVGPNVRNIVKWTHRMELANSGFVNTKLSEFDLMYKPVEMGGAFAVHPWYYMESRESYKNLLYRLYVRKQIFRFSLKESDMHTTNIMEKILKSDFFGGGRLVFGYSDYGNQPAIIDNRLLTSIQSIIDEPVHTVGNVVCNLVHGSFPSMWRSGLVKSINITDFLNAMLGGTELNLHDSNLRIRSLQKLIDISKQYDCMVVEPRHLSVNFEPVDYVTNQKARMLQRNISDEQGVNVGRQFINYADGKWIHNVVCCRQSVTEMESSESDEYNYLDVSELDWLPVQITQNKGYVACHTRSGIPLQILSQSLMMPQKVTLVMNGDITDDLDTLEEMGIDGRAQVQKVTNSVFLTAQGYRDDEDWKEQAGKADAPVAHSAEDLIMAKETEVLFDENQEESDLDEDELWDLISDEEEDNETETVTKLDVDSDEEESDDEAERIFERPMSDQGVYRPQVENFMSLAVGSVHAANRQQRKELKLRPRQRLYYLELPMDIGCSRFDDGDVSALEALMKHLDTLSYADAIWAKQYVIEALNSFGPIVSAFREEYR